jgi:hypothetical protein
MQRQVAGLNDRRYFSRQIGPDTGNFVDLFFA